MRVVVRHLGIEEAADGATRKGRSFGFDESPAVAAEARQPDDPAWDPVDGLAACERELVEFDLEQVGELLDTEPAL